MKYFVAQYGYHYPNPVRQTLSDARAEMLAEAKVSLARCRRRYGYSRMHRLSPDSIRVTMGRDKDSILYAHFSVVPV